MISAALMRRKLFALAYLGEAKGNVTEAAKIAGFSHKTAYSLGSRLLKEPAVLELIERTRAEILAKAEAVAVVDKAYVLDTIHEAVERCMQRAPVMVRRGKEVVQLVDEDGNHVWRFDSAGVFKGSELLGRTLAMFTDKLEHTGANGGPIVTAAVDLTPDERRVRLAGVLQQLLAAQREGAPA